MLWWWSFQFYTDKEHLSIWGSDSLRCSFQIQSYCWLPLQLICCEMFKLLVIFWNRLLSSSEKFSLFRNNPICQFSYSACHLCPNLNEFSSSERTTGARGLTVLSSLSVMETDEVPQGHHPFFGLEGEEMHCFY